MVTARVLVSAFLIAAANAPGADCDDSTMLSSIATSGCGVLADLLLVVLLLAPHPADNPKPPGARQYHPPRAADHYAGQHGGVQHPVMEQVCPGQARVLRARR